MANTYRFRSSQGQNHISVINSIRISETLPSTSAPPPPTSLILQEQQRGTSVPQSSDNSTAMVIDGEEEHDRVVRTQHVEASSSSLSTKAEIKYEEETSRDRGSSGTHLDALCCPICFERWTSQGPHQVSCLPCGHIYGMSCISRWIQRCGGDNAKCPQCKAKCNLEDVRKLYASPVVVIDEDLQKKIESLEAENGSLKTERANLLDVHDNLLNVQESLIKELRRIKEKPTCLENVPLGEMGRRPHGCITAKEVQEGQSGHKFGSYFGGRGPLHCNFVLEHELAVESARLFDMDASYQILILARRISGMGGTHMLNKINLINPHENEDIQLPPSTKAVKDLRVSPCGRLALLASLGKKLSILSMGSNDVAITCDLPNGMLLVFDMRQTMHPLQSIGGLTSQPIHTINSLVHNPAIHHSARKLLTASSNGPCVWNTGGARERPFLVPELENQGMCISLAYSPSSDDIVASYRPKIQTSNETISSQPLYLRSPTVLGQGILGSQVLVKRVAGSFYRNLGSVSTHLSNVQMTKSAIINVQNCFPLFAYGDEVTHGLRLRELPGLTVKQNLKPHQHPILDVKYAHSQGPGLLGCVSEDKLQLLSAKIL